MKTQEVNDKQAIEICENVGRMLAEELNSESMWHKVEITLTDYLKKNDLNLEASDLIKKLEFLVKVKLKSEKPLQAEFLGEKSKGEFIVLERKKKREIIEENKHRVDVPPDVGAEEKKALGQTGEDATSGW